MTHKNKKKYIELTILIFLLIGSLLFIIYYMYFYQKATELIFLDAQFLERLFWLITYDWVEICIVYTLGFLLQVAIGLTGLFIWMNNYPETRYKKYSLALTIFLYASVSSVLIFNTLWMLGLLTTISSCLIFYIYFNLKKKDEALIFELNKPIKMIGPYPNKELVEEEFQEFQSYWEHVWNNKHLKMELIFIEDLENEANIYKAQIVIKENN